MKDKKYQTKKEKSDTKNDPHFKIINGKEFLDTRNTQLNKICMSDVPGIISIDDNEKLIKDSYPYFRAIVNNKVKENDTHIYIYGNTSLHYIRKDDTIYHLSDAKNVQAHYLYVSHGIVVEKVNGKYRFAGAFGKSLYETAKIRKLDLLVYVKEK